MGRIGSVRKYAAVYPNRRTVTLAIEDEDGAALHEVELTFDGASELAQLLSDAAEEDAPSDVGWGPDVDVEIDPVPLGSLRRRAVKELEALSEEEAEDSEQPDEDDEEEVPMPDPNIIQAAKAAGVLNQLGRARAEGMDW